MGPRTSLVIKTWGNIFEVSTTHLLHWAHTSSD